MSVSGEAGTIVVKCGLTEAVLGLDNEVKRLTGVVMPSDYGGAYGWVVEFSRCQLEKKLVPLPVISCVISIGRRSGRTEIYSSW